jgi:hypothetical protein
MIERGVLGIVIGFGIDSVDLRYEIPLPHLFRDTFPPSMCKSYRMLDLEMFDSCLHRFGIIPCTCPPKTIGSGVHPTPQH